MSDHGHEPEHNGRDILVTLSRRSDDIEDAMYVAATRWIESYPRRECCVDCIHDNDRHMDVLLRRVSEYNQARADLAVVFKQRPYEEGEEDGG